PIENKMISNSIESAQKKVEGRNFEIRKHLVEYDDVMNKHREIIYTRRRMVLFSDNIKNDILLLMEELAEAIVLGHTDGRSREEWGLAGIAEAVRALHSEGESSFALDDILEKLEVEEIIERVKHYLWKKYHEREERLPNFDTEKKESSTMRQIERAVYLRTIDVLWMEHIDNMSHLREAVSFQGYGQRDPLIEYKGQAYEAFMQLLSSIRMDAINTLFKMKFEIERPPLIGRVAPEAMMTNEGQIESVLSGDGGSMTGNPVLIKAGSSGSRSARSQPEVGRNEPCPCGSGKKYKKCHGA
ncbi:MAG: SEC-C metal-binding domain-containing protein, partial [Patescibacteria group bacterium]